MNGRVPDAPTLATDAGGRPRMLFLCQTLPYPPDGGVEIRSYHVLRLLASVFDVTIVCFYRRASRSTEEQVVRGKEALSRFGPTEVFEIPQEHSRARFVRDHMTSLLTRRAYTVPAYESAAVRRHLAEVRAARDFDVAYIDSLDLSGYLPALLDLPVICTHHNVESDLLRRRASSETNPIARRYIAYQAALTEREERRWMPRMALNIAVSQADAARLAEIAPAARFAVVPNGVDTEAFRPLGPGSGGIVFVGGHSWYPNAEGMEFFTESILPLIRRAAPDTEVTWVGRAPKEVIDWYAERNVRLTGYVEDIRPFVEKAACFIVPLRVGGGSRLKILDAWAMGKAIVSTAVGCEGLDARDGENIVVRDEPAAFADAVLGLLSDEAARARMGETARRTACELYDWEVIGRGLTRACLDAMRPGSQAAARKD